MANILIVDDDLVNAQIYAYKLKNEGHQVTTSTDGQSAQKEIAKKFDLILLDIMMPKIDGTVLLAEIKKGTNKDTPVLVHTNLLSESIKEKCLKNLGAREYLIKADLTPTQLVEKIEGYLKTGNMKHEKF